MHHNLLLLSAGIQRLWQKVVNRSPWPKLWAGLHLIYGALTEEL